jgi:hypothetical protein
MQYEDPGQTSEVIKLCFPVTKHLSESTFDKNDITIKEK